MRILAIDLGTSNTVAAIENFPLPISGEDGRSTLPSVVSFLPDGTIQYGIQAKRRRSIDPPNTIFSAKRIMGRRWSDAKTRDFRDRYPFEMIEIDDDTPAFDTRAGPFTATDIAATLLSGIFSQVKHVPGGFERTCCRESSARSSTFPVASSGRSCPFPRASTDVSAAPPSPPRKRRSCRR